MRYTFIYNNVVENNIYFTEFADLFGRLAVGVFAYSYTGDYKHSSCNQCISNTGVTLPFIVWRLGDHIAACRIG